MKSATFTVLLMMCFFLSGCAGLNVAGNETSVVINPISDVSEAFPVAEKHCANYSKVAHFSRMEGFRAVFDCETRGAR